MKLYNTVEMIKMITEDKDLKFKALNGTNVTGTVGYCMSEYQKAICWLADESDDDVYPFQINETTLGYRYELIPKAMTFMEALKCGKRVRLEHKILSRMSSNCNCSESFIVTYVKQVINNEYLTINNLMSALSWYASATDWDDIIKNGKFYAEE